MFGKYFVSLFIFFVAFMPKPAFAEYCVDRPKSVIIHTNQYIYFTTETLCQDWCLLPASWNEATKDRAFSMLMTAIAQNKPVTFFFPTTCVRQATYAEPHMLQLNR